MVRGGASMVIGSKAEDQLARLLSGLKLEMQSQICTLKCAVYTLSSDVALAKELSMHNMQMKAAHGKAQESIYPQRNSDIQTILVIYLLGLHVNKAFFKTKAQGVILSLSLPLPPDMAQEGVILFLSLSRQCIKARRL
ncbi:CTC-interacting domain 7 [Salvia divinorum]|uniref:CTC-interacting domain 7 n=1 Tax=Salvia divinorum TaxID=28513 RepID=A0ABD1HAK4_SALDI